MTACAVTPDGLHVVYQLALCTADRLTVGPASSRLPSVVVNELQTELGMKAAYVARLGAGTAVGLFGASVRRRPNCSARRVVAGTLGRSGSAGGRATEAGLARPCIVIADDESRCRSERFQRQSK